jgi:hypothetical protein
MMTPTRQHATPVYTYGGPTPGSGAFVMPKLSSPSMNPASQSPQVSNMGGSSTGHIPIIYSNSPSAMPAYVGSTP